MNHCIDIECPLCGRMFCIRCEGTLCPHCLTEISGGDLPELLRKKQVESLKSNSHNKKLKTMELNKFSEKFLPDYEARLNRFRIEEGYTPVAFEINGVKEFCVRNFPEALQYFTDRLCKKQRESCEKMAFRFEFNNGHGLECGNAILNAQQPQIEEV